MTAVTLVSGGLDSSLVALMAREEGVEQFPLFIHYGQRSYEREWKACKDVLRAHQLPRPTSIKIPGYGRVIQSGLTSADMHIRDQAFLPGRNFMFLLCAAAFAVQNRADTVMIGLLNEETHLFPDQTKGFLAIAQEAISTAMGRALTVVAPLIELYKADVIALARKRGLRGTYSCHKGAKYSCGSCISCLEFVAAK